MITKKTVVDFAEVMKAYGLTKLEIKDDEKYILLESGRGAGLEGLRENIPPVLEEASHIPPAKENDVEPEIKSGYVQKSIIVGIIYLSPAEGMDTFVKVGDRISKGDVLCMVESMKMFNEINAEVSGTVREILVSNGQTIEFGQPLFVIDTDEEA